MFLISLLFASDILLNKKTLEDIFFLQKGYISKFRHQHGKVQYIYDLVWLVISESNLKVL